MAVYTSTSKSNYHNSNRELSNFSDIPLLAYEPEYKNVWKRPGSWLDLDEGSISPGDEIIKGLIAITNGGAFINFQVAGDYQVDFGVPGATGLFASGAEAEYEYDYFDPSLDGTNAPVTLADSGDLVQRNNHGYVDDDVVRFYNVATVTSVLETQEYYVINATTNNFQISETRGGDAVTFGADGTADLLPYKQAIVTITPQSGANITSFDFNQYNSNMFSTTSNGLIDVVVNGPNITTLQNAFRDKCKYLKRINIKEVGNVTTLENFALACHSLEEVLFPDNNTIPSTVTNMNAAFRYCYSLKTISLRTTAAATFQNTFADCYSLLTASIDAPNATNLQASFYQCYSLRNVNLNIPACTNMTQTFQDCQSLERIFLNIPACTNMTQTFQNCYSLRTANIIGRACTSFFRTFINCISLTDAAVDCSSGTSLNEMFRNCVGLTRAPNLILPTVNWQAPNMFYECKQLKEIEIDISKCTSPASMFGLCSSLRKAYIQTSGSNTAASYSSMFSECSSLVYVSPMNIPAGTLFTSMFQNCYSLPEITLFLGSSSTSINFESFAATAIGLKRCNIILSSGSVSNCRRMFNGCNSLTEPPSTLMNTSSCTNFGDMFNGCLVLEYIPTYDTSAGTNFGGMFNNCQSLRELPELDLSNASTVGSFVNSCYSLTRLKIIPPSVNWSVQNCRLSAEALDEIYTNLPSASATLTVSNNYGTSADDPTIATAKGWTVTGS